MLIVAYFLEVGLVLVIAPWTAFWERNVFVIASGDLSDILLSPWLRGALSGVGVVTFVAGLLDLVALFVRREPSETPSPQSPR